MIKGWRMKPEWIRLQQERTERRINRIIQAAQIRTAEEMREADRKAREAIMDVRYRHWKETGDPLGQ